MMKKFLIAATLLLFLTTPVWAGFEHSIFASYIDSKDIGSGWGAGLKTEFNLFDLLGIDTRISYVEFDAGSTYMIPLEASLVLNIPLADQRFNPYAGVGVGFYIMDSKIANLDDPVGYYPFLGLKAGIEHLAFMGEVRWLGLEASATNTINELSGKSKAKVDGLGVNLGIVIRW
jgi:hypothetical protein